VRPEEGEKMSRYVASRWVMRKHLVFPMEIFIEKFHVRTRKRRLPWFWIVNEESIPLSKVASIKIHKGFFFSDMIIENSGGDYPIRIIGVTNAVARKIRAELEIKERAIARDYDRLKRDANAPARAGDPADYAEDDEFDITVHAFEEK
jgi:hypothetical protein